MAVAYNHHGTRMACATAKHSMQVTQAPAASARAEALGAAQTAALTPSSLSIHADLRQRWRRGPEARGRVRGEGCGRCCSRGSVPKRSSRGCTPELGETLAVSVAGQPVELWRERPGGSGGKSWEQVSVLRDSRAAVR